MSKSHKMIGFVISLKHEQSFKKTTSHFTHVQANTHLQSMTNFLFSISYIIAVLNCG